jgi:tetratricopeptide (TPR) repeat protein
VRLLKTHSLIFLLLCGVSTHRALAQANSGQKLAIALALERQGRTAQTIQDLQALLDSNSLKPPEAGKAWNILGLAYQDQGDFSHAQRAYEHSIQILERLPNNARDYAMVLDDLGGIYLAVGRPETAMSIKLKTLRLYQKIGDHTGMAIANSNLAATALNLKRVRAARKYLEQAQREALLSVELDDDDRAAMSSMQGWLAQVEGDSVLAVTKYQYSLDVWKRRHGEEHRLTGWGYILVGNAEANMGQLIVALANMEHGLQILDRALGRQNPRYIMAEIAYSSVLDRTDAHTEAARIKSTAERELKEFHRRQCGDCTISVAALH